MTDKPSSLADLLDLAEWGPRQLVAAVNARLSRQGRDKLRLDPTAAYPWVRRGFRPRPPIPDLVAAVLTERLGVPVTVDQLWPGRTGPASEQRSAATGLDAVTHVDDLVRELAHLATTAVTPQSPIRDASGADLTAAVLDQLHGAVLAARTRAGYEYVLSEQVDAIASHVAALRRLDDRHGGGALSVRYVTAELRSVMDLVEYANYDVVTGRRLMTIVADLAQLLGWLHFDSSRYGSAERYLLLSVGMCRALADYDRAANVIGMLSYVSAFAGHGPQAVRLADAAKAECRSSDLVLQARLMGREATAAAADGDLARFRRCADQANALLDSCHAQDRPSFLYYLNPAQLAAETGQALVVLAERTTTSRDRLLGEGIDVLATAVSDMLGASNDGKPLYARSGLLHSTFLARAHLLCGDLGEAVATMRAGLGLLPLVQSPRGRHYLRTLRPALARRSRSSIVRKFLPEFDAALSTP
ncbi:hypothetical protein HC031_25420 [Planosporangium thailandense]|uniref:Transcriptional regulator n=1 Tax=Planosporangium thailandense TaxID=765197 RepID=A0ABX0Y646_9ACTN|nr:hypothetical protein [Planosporangium thailandense]NJC73030.1 hypothetical protein [Planosporangium thailandense]